jgi:hypothetical protein
MNRTYLLNRYLSARVLVFQFHYECNTELGSKALPESRYESPVKINTKARSKIRYESPVNFSLRVDTFPIGR